MPKDAAPVGVIYLDTRPVPLDELTPFPGNAKRGDVEAIRASLKRNGQYRSLVVREVPNGPLIVLAGNHTLQALAAEGHDSARCEIVRCDDATARRINLADNRTAELGAYDDDALAALLKDLDGDYDGTGWNEEDLEALTVINETEQGPALADDELPIPEPPADPVSRIGDLWILGEHRLLCGDSTNPEDVRRVVGDNTVSLIHADPPYGMGKEADGVLNDNLYGPRLDAFQMKWWNAWLPTLADNASAYVWGNAPDLWRLWWTGGLGTDPNLLVRNEIVWDKGSAIGMRSEGAHSYPIATERCLFLMRGQQFLGNQNKDDYWEGYEPLRAWLCAERDKLGWTSKDVNQLTATQMAGHWFSKSQFAPIPEHHYATLQAAAAGRAFVTSYRDLFDDLFPDARVGGNSHRRDLSAQLRETRSYFDNTHETMTDVWQFPRVIGEERHGHATPKPVAMVERAMRSSSELGDIIGVPFGGSGPEFIAATRLGCRCLGIELEPRYVDVICRRFEEHTGIIPERALSCGSTEPVSFI
jgi:DNA modification methylase